MRFSLGRKLVATVVMGGAMLFAAHTMLAQDSGHKASGPRKLTGVLSDNMCNGNHNGKDAAKCAAACVGKGAGYALVMDGGRVVALDEAPAAETTKLLGQKATVTGTMSGKDKMKVTKVMAAQS